VLMSVAGMLVVMCTGTPPAAAAPLGTTSADPGPPGGAGTVRYSWPLSPMPAVAVPSREPTHRFGPGHRGVDLVAAPGSAVIAAAPGTVVFAGLLAGRGVVSLQHADGLRTTYEPVVPVVVAGTTVGPGTVLGTVSAGHGACPTACLHWGVRRERGSYLDPLLLVMPTHVRLLPVPEPWPGPASAGELPEPGAQPAHQTAVQLADPRLGDAEHPADLGEGAVLQVVHAQDQAVPLAELSR